MNDIPRGIEVLVKKASVDGDFKALLLERRSRAADEIGLTLEPAEAAMLDAVPDAQLETIIANTTVAPSRRAAFVGTAAAIMLAALGAASCDEVMPVTGIAPDRPPKRRSSRLPHLRAIVPYRPLDVGHARRAGIGQCVHRQPHNLYIGTGGFPGQRRGVAVLPVLLNPRRNRVPLHLRAAMHRPEPPNHRRHQDQRNPDQP